MNKILEPLRAAKAAKAARNTFEPEVQAAIMMDPAKRDPLQAMMYHTAEPRVAFDRGAATREPCAPSKATPPSAMPS